MVHCGNADSTAGYYGSDDDDDEDDESGGSCNSGMGN